MPSQGEPTSGTQQASARLAVLLPWIFGSADLWLELSIFGRKQGSFTNISGLAVSGFWQ